MRFFRALFLMLGLAALPACAAVEAPVEARPMQPVTSAPAALPAPHAPAAIPAAEDPRSFVVRFDVGSADIRASAMQIIYEASQVAGRVKPATIRIHGYTDRSGKSAYNQRLSERRAKAVADQLAKLGVTVAVVETKGFGETKGKEAARDQRRVEIVFEGGAPHTAAQDAPAKTPPAKTSPAKADKASVQALSETVATDAPVTALARVSPPVTLQTDGKHAIKRDRVRMGSAWIPPAAAPRAPSRMGGRAV